MALGQSWMDLEGENSGGCHRETRFVSMSVLVSPVGSGSPYHNNLRCRRLGRTRCRRKRMEMCHCASVLKPEWVRGLVGPNHEGAQKEDLKGMVSLCLVGGTHELVSYLPYLARNQARTRQNTLILKSASVGVKLDMRSSWEHTRTHQFASQSMPVASGSIRTSPCDVWDQKWARLWWEDVRGTPLMPCLSVSDSASAPDASSAF